MAQWSREEKAMLDKALRERAARTAAVQPSPEPGTVATPRSMNGLNLRREMGAWAVLAVGLSLLVWWAG